MPLATKDAFKLGFLTRCADECLSAEDTAERIHRGAVMQKQAVAGVAAGAGLGAAGAAKGLSSLAKTLWSLGGTGLLAGAGISAGVGGAGGLLAAKMTERDVDADEYKKRELIQQYQEFAQRARASAAKRQAAASRPNTSAMAFA
jgi:hypothetical protein